MPYIEDINRQYIYSFLHFIITDKTCQQILSPKSLITPLPFGEGLGVRLCLSLGEGLGVRLYLTSCKASKA